MAFNLLNLLSLEKEICMRKTFSSMIILFILTIFAPIHLNATIIEYDAGTYVTPEDFEIICQIAPIDLIHDYYYIIGLRDIRGENVDALNIVFRGIYNWIPEDNWLSIYLFDNTPVQGLSMIGDGSITSNPDWEGSYNATCLGTWSYLAEAKDVVFSTTDENLLSYMQNGNRFGIGIDPDCHFYGTSIDIEVATSPVPEPTTLLLLGSGLLGLAGFRRKQG